MDFPTNGATCIERKTRCMTLTVDATGKDGSNQLGRDCFIFHILPFTDQLAPNHLFSGYNGEDWGSNDVKAIETNCNTSGGPGDFCSAKIIRDGWQMNY